MNKQNIGFMQGRLSPIVDGKIQCFPWNNWKNEFIEAQNIGLQLMEWTLDQERLYENPLMTKDGQQQIIDLSNKHGVKIKSLTGDCFMQAPFWKASDSQTQQRLKHDFEQILQACQTLEIEFIVVPLVDDGRLETPEQDHLLRDFLMGLAPKMEGYITKIIFESDENPTNLAHWIEQLPKNLFGINYDIGNSAALGYDPKEELESYGHRVLNLHIKDRVLGGTTVALGEGSADFEKVFKSLKECNYHGNYILQTARSSSGDHAGALSQYKSMTENWITQHGL